MTSLKQQKTEPLSEEPLVQSVTEADVEVNSVSNTYGVYWFILVSSVALLIVLPEQAAWVKTKRGWYTQPMIGPLLGITILATFSALRLLVSFKLDALKRLNPLEELAQAAGNYRVALFSSALFFLYINTLSVFGFALATLLFVSTLLWLSRLLDRFWFSCTFLTITALILIFRVGVSIWLPDVWLYGLLPDNWADFANQYL